MDNRVTILSFLWMFAIVLFHAENGTSPRWYAELMSDFRIGGVAFFYVVSGFFLMKHWGERPILVWWKDELRKRLRSLGIPYLIWCLLGVSGTDVLQQFGVVGVCPTANPPLWYVKFLLLFCLLSPLVVQILRRIVNDDLLSAFALVTITTLPWLPLPMKFSFFLSVLMFAIGVGLAFDAKSKRTYEWQRVRWVGVLGFIWVMTYGLRVLWPECSTCAVWPLKVYSAISLMALSWLALNFCRPPARVPSVLQVTFFVYCAHGIVLRYLPHWNVAYGSFLKGVCAFVCSLGFAMGVRSCSRTLYSLLTGSR